MFSVSVRMSRAVLAAGTVLLAAHVPALAQPTQAQQSALRSNCRSDFMSHCSGVTPGGSEALQCLIHNVAKLSPGCQGAVHAVMPPSPPPQQTVSAPAAAPPSQAPSPSPATSAASASPAPTAAHAPASAPSLQRTAKTPNPHASVVQACRSDFGIHCKGVAPGGAAAQQCLQRNASRLSPSCARALVAAGGGAAPVSAPVATLASAPTAAPTAEQQQAIKFTCRRDFVTNCRGVTPGGPEALACLQRNGARLSPDCRTSIAAIEDGAEAATAATASPSPPAARRPVGPLRRAIRERMMER